MMQPCKWIVPAMALLLLGMPLAGQAQSPRQVYTWVDKNGVRHYSDHPANPKAVLLTVRADEAGSAPVPATVPVSGAVPASARVPQTVPRPQPQETPEERAARCSKLQKEVEQLQSARRVEVTENGTKRYYSGEDLVKFRQKMEKRMQAACTQPSQ